ncbi:MAG: hypothetical protein ACT4O0_14250 [Pseudonocardia sp.]
MPNPSGLNAHRQLPELTAEFARLRAAAQMPDVVPDAGTERNRSPLPGALRQY